MQRGARRPVHEDVAYAGAVDGREAEIEASGRRAQGPKQGAKPRVACAKPVDDVHVGLVVDDEDDVGVGDVVTVLGDGCDGAEELAPRDSGARVLAARVTVGVGP